MNRDEPDQLSSALVAEITHNALVAYDEAMRTPPPPQWSAAPSWMKQAAIDAVERLRRDVSDGPALQHQRWMAAKVADGWQHGPTKDAARRTHPMLMDYAQLPALVKTRDRLFVATVQALTGVS